MPPEHTHSSDNLRIIFHCIVYDDSFLIRVSFQLQDICLYEDFTISETLQYFGTICGMSNDEIEDQVDFLIDFLDLPPAFRTVRTLRYEI